MVSRSRSIGFGWGWGIGFFYYKIGFNKFREIEIIFCVLYDYNVIKLNLILNIFLGSIKSNKLNFKFLVSKRLLK